MLTLRLRLLVPLPFEAIWLTPAMVLADSAMPANSDDAMRPRLAGDDGAGRLPPIPFNVLVPATSNCFLSATAWAIFR